MFLVFLILEVNVKDYTIQAQMILICIRKVRSIFTFKFTFIYTLSLCVIVRIKVMRWLGLGLELRLE